MSFNAAMLEAMRAEGLDLDACIRVVRAAENKSDPTAAERKRRQRVREKEGQETNGHAVTVTRDKGSNDRDILTSQNSPPNVISNEITPPAENPEIELKPEHVVEVWNDLAVKHGLAAVKKITPERRKKLNTFIRRHTIDDITEAILAIPRSPFLLGQNQRGWQASFDWFLEPRNLTKLTEGTYVH
jgi:hypothetical protein